jgi:hypothetical protein
MSDDFRTRREQLAARIARQRTELGQAYRNLEKPIHYAEYGMRGFGFIRSNPWIFAAVPAVFSMTRLVFGGKKKKASKLPPSHEQTQTKNKRPLQIWTSRAWQLYQLYRRVRSFIP